MKRQLATAFGIAALVTPLAAYPQWYQGPSGGTGGQSFDGWVLNNHATDIRTVVVISRKSDKAVQCLIADYPVNPAAPAAPVVTGSAGPANCNTANTADISVNFDLAPDEYILGVSGTYTDHVTSLRMYTNKRNSPVYGESQTGASFGYTAPTGQMIVAFTQTLDERLRSIGVMYAPCDRATKACK